MQHSYCTDIPWGEAQPGDLLIVHCSGGANGVVITGSAGFTAVASPNLFKA